MNSNALQVNYHAMLLQSPNPSALLDLDSGLLADVNATGRSAVGPGRAQQLIGMSLAELCPPAQPGGQRSAELLRAAVDARRQRRRRAVPRRRAAMPAAPRCRAKCC